MQRQPFDPGPLLRHPYLQTALASLAIRLGRIRGGDRSFETREQERILDCGAGVRLQGFHSAAAGSDAPRGLAVLLHGWEGSARSTYILSLGYHLHRHGWDVFRLNFRDHGETHHLNEELFHSCRLDEVAGAVAAIAGSYPRRPLCLVGFSLGGNFALRVALRAPGAGIPLDRVVAVAPVISPRQAMLAMERARIVHDYFARKWRRSLRRKQQLFPDKYDWEAWIRVRSLREMTRWIIERTSEFASLEDYLDGYSIAGGRLRELSIPATLIAAADDPVIPVDDFRRLELPDHVDLCIEPRGGHCGFIQGLRLDSWIDERIRQILEPLAAGFRDRPVRAASWSGSSDSSGPVPA